MPATWTNATGTAGSWTTPRTVANVISANCVSPDFIQSQILAQQSLLATLNPLFVNPLACQLGISPLAQLGINPLAQLGISPLRGALSASPLGTSPLAALLGANPLAAAGFAGVPSLTGVPSLQAAILANPLLLNALLASCLSPALTTCPSAVPTVLAQPCVAGVPVTNAGTSVLNPFNRACAG